jgi:hypothetical protein
MTASSTSLILRGTHYLLTYSHEENSRLKDSINAKFPVQGPYSSFILHFHYTLFHVYIHKVGFNLGAMGYTM